VSRSLINRAIDDLKDTDSRLRAVEKDLAMAFVLGEDCEAWCLELEIDYEAVREKAAALYRRIVGKETGAAPGRCRTKRPAKPRTCPDMAAARKTQYRYR
jgi:hypothetical protein